LGLERWTGYGSLFVLLGSGAWVYRHRTIDIWLLIGVVALVARFWTYHRWYDDLILLLPLVTLCRLAKRGPSIAERRVATLLAAFTLASLLAPGGLYLLPATWRGLYLATQFTVWVLVSVFSCESHSRPTRSYKRNCATDNGGDNGFRGQDRSLLSRAALVTQRVDQNT
jgi:hypothetical protein